VWKKLPLVLPFMVEVESGKKNDRPVLADALDKCRLFNATLLVAKVDRLARDAAFVSRIMAGDVPVVFCDLPQSHAGTSAVTKFIIGMLAQVAELEAGFISERTKAGLAVAKAKGKKLGGLRPKAKAPDWFAGGAATAAKADAHAKRLEPILRELQTDGLSLHQIAARMVEMGVATPRGGAWTATAVRRALARIDG
jgi:DNA invertase Pin-like site-specific DNA recombinase